MTVTVVFRDVAEMAACAWGMGNRAGDGGNRAVPVEDPAA